MTLDGRTVGERAIVALDVGGANLKLSDGRSHSHQVAFALWKQPLSLTDAIAALLAEAPSADAVAVTMTGELADCFSSKRQGVSFILDCVCRAAEKLPVTVYLTDGRLVSLDEAVAVPQLAAASNWHVLATFAARVAGPRSGCLIDIGSTTSDIIPFADGQVIAQGSDDVGRLLSGELVYSGVGRTPVCGLIQAADYQGQRCSIAKEFFATTQDVYLALDELPELPHANDTADGRPATKSAARSRLARMFCVDGSSFSQDDAISLATLVAQRQLDELLSAVMRVTGRLPTGLETFVISGSGEFLAKRVASGLDSNARVISMARQFGADMSQCATAYALARLMRGHDSDE